MPGYRCATCGQYHDGPTLGFGFEAPVLYYQIPENERAGRTELSTDACVVDGKSFFVLGNIELPIIGTAEKFVWSAWVSLSEKNFKRTLQLWEQTGRESEPPYFGWLSSSVPTYPETVNLKTSVHTRPVGVRPLVELESTGHPLAREQRDGITWQRVHEINAALEHSA